MSARERRRRGERRVFAIEISSCDLRVVELQTSADADRADEVSATTCCWQREARAFNSPESRAELAAAFREISRDRGMHGAEIRVVLSGEFCVLRTVRGALDAVRAELSQLEQRSRLYLSLGPGEKVVVSHIQALDARHAHALAAVCNRATLDSIQAAADAAGVEIAVIEPALAALNRATTRTSQPPEGAYLLCHLTPAGMEIGVCHGGQVLLDYRPAGRTEVKDLPALLETNRSRLSRHVGRCLRTSPPELTQIFLCGDEELVAAAAHELRQSSTFGVSALRPADVKATWQIHQDGGEVSAAALGALLAVYAPAGDVDSPNLMQHIIDRKLEPLRPRLIRSLMPLAATLLAMATLSVVNVRQQSALDSMQAELDELAVAAARANELRLNLLASKGKLIELQKLAAQLPPDLGDTLVRRLAGCLPNDVWLSRLEVADRSTIRVTGASYQEAGVYDFVRWLEKAPGLTEVALKGTSPSYSATGPTTNFDLELSLAESDDAVTEVARHE